MVYNNREDKEGDMLEQNTPQEELSNAESTTRQTRSKSRMLRSEKFQIVLKWTKRILLAIASMITLGAIAVFMYIFMVLQNVPTLDVQKFNTQSTSNMYDKDGNLIWSDTQRRRDFVSITDVPKEYKDLLLATEDNDFYEHPGFSVKAILNAIKSQIQEKIFKKGSGRGGSTIEQQLVKNHVFSQSEADRSIDRKIKEVWIASQLDMNYSKDQILEWYVNTIELGERSYGINTISLTYFGKPISELNSGSDEDISKLAIIAGLGQAPSTYNLYDNPEAVEERRYEVLLSAVKHGKLTQEQMDRINKIPVTDGLKERFWRDEEVLKTMTTYSAHITAALQQVERLGYDISKTPLQIYTTLDREATDKLQSIIDNAPGLRTDEQQMAATVIDNETGHVIAQVGGRYQTEPMSLNRAIQRNRSTGSSIKPILDYAPAIEYLGYGTQTLISGAAYQYPGTNYVAYNYGGTVAGMTDLQTALRLSLNTTANRLLDEHVGSTRAKQFMSKMKDLDVKDEYGGTDALGLDLSTADLASGYAAFARYGQYQQAQYVTKLVFSDGSSKDIKFERVQAMMPSTAYIMLKILEGVPNYSEQGAQMPELSVAMKTGTTAYASNTWPDHAASDIWIAATTKSITTAIWSGYDVPQEEFVYDNSSTRREVVKSIIRTFSQGRDSSEWSNPGNVVSYGSGISSQHTPTKVYTEPDYSLAKIETNDGTYSNTIKSMLSVKDLKIAPEKEIKLDELQKKLDEASKWHQTLTGQDKSLYDLMLSGQEIKKPKLSNDVYDNRENREGGASTNANNNTTRSQN